MSIVRVETVRVSDLAQDAAINPTKLSRIIGKLEAEGWVVCTCDTDDARVIRLSVTTERIALRNEICAEQTETLLYALRCITKNESQALNAAVPVLDKVVELLRAGF
jgi:DNA-binding MarR family transcriptional regulator